MTDRSRIFDSDSGREIGLYIVRGEGSIALFVDGYY